MHAIDKASIVDAELAGSTVVADSLFPKDAPYCNVDLTPRWDYDIEKAKLMNCPTVSAAEVAQLKSEKDDLAEELANEKEKFAQEKESRDALEKELTELRDTEVNAAC